MTVTRATAGHAQSRPVGWLMITEIVFFNRKGRLRKVLEYDIVGRIKTQGKNRKDSSEDQCQLPTTRMALNLVPFHLF